VTIVHVRGHSPPADDRAGPCPVTLSNDGTNFAIHLATTFRRFEENDVIARSIGIALGALVLTPLAAADDSGVYIGATVGYVDTPDTVQLGVPDVPLLTGKTDDTVFTPGLEIGYRFNRNIAVELGYVDLGDLKADLVDLGGGTDATAQTNFSADGISLSLVGTFPMGKWEPYVKAGALFSSTTLKYSGAVSGNAFAAGIDNNAEDALYGLGVRYALTDRVKLVLDSTYYQDVGEPRHGQAQYFKTSLGILWQF
jgi:opacity protein-like surface antigen